MNDIQKMTLFSGLIAFSAAGILVAYNWPDAHKVGGQSYKLLITGELLRLLILWATIGVVVAGLIYLFKSDKN